MQFDIVQCVKAGDGFKYGEQYAMLGWNNGLHVVRENESGDVHECIVHNYDDLLKRPDMEGPDFMYARDIEGDELEDSKITISLGMYNGLHRKALIYSAIIRTIKHNINRDDINPVKEDEILTLTGLYGYQQNHYQAMANRAASKIAKPEEDADDAEDQTEL